MAKANAAKPKDGLRLGRGEDKDEEDVGAARAVKFIMEQAEAR